MRVMVIVKASKQEWPRSASVKKNHFDLSIS
jgi:hypothetical protein